MHRPVLRLHAVAAGVTTLGPGPAAVVWVQGCPLRCRGCMSPTTLGRDGGASAFVDDVAAWALAQGHDHLTVSGGEPTAQAPAVVALVDAVRAARDVTVTCYSGFRLEQLQGRGDAEVDALLRRVDLLIDGPYREDLHEPRRWRGSSNQRLHHLTDRVPVTVDEPAGMEVAHDVGGAFRLIGVPPAPGLARRLERRLTESFSSLGGDGPSFPFPTVRG